MTIHSIQDDRAEITIDGINRTVNLLEIRKKILRDEDRDGEAGMILKAVIHFRLKQQENEKRN